MLCLGYLVVIGLNLSNAIQLLHVHTYVRMPTIMQCMTSYSVECYAICIISEMFEYSCFEATSSFCILFGKLNHINGRFFHLC